MKSIFYFRLSVVLILSLACGAFVARAQTTEFTHQGRLTDSDGNALTGSYDFEFQLLEANSNPLGTQTRLGVSVSNGAFTTTLDFGANPQQFTGAPRLLKISVRPAGSGAYAILSPNQPITSAPYSIRSREATTADAATNATQLGGVPAARFVQSDAGGNVSVGGNLNVGGTLTQPIVNATTEFQIGGQRVLSSPANTDNLFVGRSAGQNNGISALANTFIGSTAGRANTSGGFNTFVGASAGLSNTTAEFNTFLGASAGRFNTTGGSNTFVGLAAGSNNTTGQNNSFFGKGAGGECGSLNPCLNPQTGADNSFFGFETGFSNTTGANNSFFGKSAGRLNTTGFRNSFFGVDAGRDSTTGSNNSIFGYAAGIANTGTNNAFFGSSAGSVNAGGLNSFFGISAGSGNTSGGRNSFFGANAGETNTTGERNSFFGSAAGINNTTGARNSFFGDNAGGNNETASDNSFFGHQAGVNTTTGGSNVIIGVNTGLANTIGSNNTIIGRSANTGANNLTFASAFGAGATVGDSNSVVLGRAADTVRIPGNLNLTGSFTGNFTVPAANVTGVLSQANGGTNLSSSGAAGNFLRSNGTTWTSAPLVAADIPNSAAVKSLNNLTGGVTLAAGANVTVTASGNTLTIASTGGGSGCGEPCVANVFNANSQYNLGGQRFISRLGEFSQSLTVGIEAGASSGSSAFGNTYVGYRAGFSHTLGADNAFFGSLAGFNLTNGARNSFFGSAAGKFSTGVDNSLFGYCAGCNSQTGNENSFFGKSSGISHSTGNNNSYYGTNAGNGVFFGSNNTFIGRNTRLQFTVGNGTASNNTLLGANASVIEELNFATAIGADATVTANNTIALGRSGGQDTVRIYGNLVVVGTINGVPRHAQNEILEASVKNQETQIQTQADQIQKQTAQLAAQQKQIERQQLVIDGLRKILCAQNPSAEVCREQEK